MKYHDVWEPLNSIRLKVTDRCHWNCWWCHNEGTGARNPNLIGDILWDDSTRTAIEKIANFLNLTEVHLTGGEPTLHPQLTSLIKGIRALGLNVKATSIGCDKNRLQQLAESGLQGINFSVHSIDAELLHLTQRNRSFEWVSAQLERQINAVLFARQIGLDVKINSVLATEDDIPRVLEVLNWAKENNIPFRVMNEFSSSNTSYQAIRTFIKKVGAFELYTKRIAGSSSVSTYFSLPDGYIFAFKKIEHLWLKTMCNNCSLKDRGICGEGFYGIRIEKRKTDHDWKLFVRLCIHRTNSDTLLPVDRFLSSTQIMEIKEAMKIPVHAFDIGLSSCVA